MKFSRSLRALALCSTLIAPLALTGCYNDMPEEANANQIYNMKAQAPYPGWSLKNTHFVYRTKGSPVYTQVSAWAPPEGYKDGRKKYGLSLGLPEATCKTTNKHQEYLSFTLIWKNDSSDETFIEDYDAPGTGTALDPSHAKYDQAPKIASGKSC